MNILEILQKGQSAFYILEMEECVEPWIHGPYKTDGDRIRAVQAMNNLDSDKRNSFCRLDVNPNGLVTSSFVNYEVEPD